MFYSCEKSLSRKNPVLPIKKIPSLVQQRLQHLIIQFTLYYLSSGRLRKLKNKRTFQTFNSESGRGRLREVVAYKRFQIQWFDFNLLFWKTGRWREVVAYERWSQPESRLYYSLIKYILGEIDKQKNFHSALIRVLFRLLKRTNCRFA